MAVFAGVGILPAGSTWSAWLLARRLETRGIETRARVLSRSAKSDGDGTTYRIRYRFTERRGSIERVEDVNEVLYRAARENEPIRVRYLPENPQDTARIGVGPGPASLTLSTLFSVVWSAIAGGVLTGLWSARARARRLADAPRVEAEIVAAEGAKDGDGDFNLALSYALISPGSGARLVREDTRVRNDLSRAPTVGTKIVVLYGGDHDLLPL